MYREALFLQLTCAAVPCIGQMGQQIAVYACNEIFKQEIRRSPHAWYRMDKACKDIKLKIIDTHGCTLHGSTNMKHQE